jgi:hypothetical protein
MKCSQTDVLGYVESDSPLGDTVRTLIWLEECNGNMIYDASTDTYHCPICIHNFNVGREQQRIVIVSRWSSVKSFLLWPIRPLLRLFKRCSRC